MKHYKCVLKKAAEINYKKGINTIDEDSNIYKTLKVLFILSFIWFAIFQALYLIGNITVYIGYPASVQNVNVPLLITSAIVFPLMITALVFTKFKMQMIPFFVTLVSGIAQIVMVNKVDDLRLQIVEHSIIATKYFWRHHAPIILMIIFALGMLIIGISRRRYLKGDYQGALNAMFTVYSAEHPGASDNDWTAYLEELDTELIEAEKAEKMKKKRKK